MSEDLFSPAQKLAFMMNQISRRKTRLRNSQSHTGTEPIAKKPRRSSLASQQPVVRLTPVELNIEDNNNDVKKTTRSLSRGRRKKAEVSVDTKEEDFDVSHKEKAIKKKVHVRQRGVPGIATDTNMCGGRVLKPLTKLVSSSEDHVKVMSRKAKGRPKRRSIGKVSYKESQSSEKDTDSASDCEASSESSSDSFKHVPKKSAGKRKSTGQSNDGKPDGKEDDGTPTAKVRSCQKPMPHTSRSKSSKVLSEFELAKSKPRISAKENKKLAHAAAVSYRGKVTKAANKTAKSADDSSSDDGADWEEVEDSTSHLIKRDLKITVDITGVKKKKKFDWVDYAKMLWRRYQREQHECVHKIELMCLLVHGRLVNDVCNDPLLKAISLSIFGKAVLKGKQCTQSNLADVISKLKEKVTLEPSELVTTQQGCINTVTLLQTLVEGINTGVLTRNDEYILLMVSVLRAMGAATRLCIAWYPTPFQINHFKKLQKTSNPQPSSSRTKSSTGKQNKSKGKGAAQLFKTDNPETLNENFDRQTWLEIYIDQSWKPMDSSGTIVTDTNEIEVRLNKPVTYIESYDNNGKMKDLTPKYDSKWLLSTSKLRVEQDWWEEMITPYHVKKSNATLKEDEEIRECQERMPFPDTIGGFKDHQLYVLERHILKFQAIYPPTAIPLGYTKTNEPIYSRSCVHTLHSRETWLKDARQIKMGEEAYKYVKPRPKMKDIKNGVKITEATLPIYGLWQTEPFVPPVAENGKVPKNGYGNVELFKPEMLPVGCVLIKDCPHIGRIARKLKIDYAEAMIGWDLRKGRTVPVMDGWVVCQEHKDVLMAAVQEFEANIAEKEREKREKRVYSNWRTVIKGLLIREGLRKKYGEDAF